jgi:RNA polymerase sigma-70 factor (ECF subfamily)
MTPSELDRSAMERVRAGDRSALAELYDRHTPLLHALALRIVRRATDAEDVVQETWVQAWRSAARYDRARGSVVAWLITIARSRAIDRLRSMASRLNAETAAEAEAGLARTSAQDAPAAASAASELGGRVRAALTALPERQRHALELAYFGGLSQSEIAARLDAPLGTVKSWSRQGLLRLRELLPGEDA